MPDERFAHLLGDVDELFFQNAPAIETAFITERPEDYRSVHRIAVRAIEQVNSEAADLLVAYHGRHANANTRAFITSAMTHLRRLAVAAAVLRLNSETDENDDHLAGGFTLQSSSDVEALCYEATGTMTKEGLISDSVQIARRLNAHLRHLLRFWLDPTLQRLQQTADFVQKYCQSFWTAADEEQFRVPILDNLKDPPEGGDEVELRLEKWLSSKKKWNLLQALVDYEQLRVNSMGSICGIADVRQQTKGFCGDGVAVDQFVLDIRIMADKTLCRSAPILLLIPNAVEVIHTLCKQLRFWLESDKDYLAQINHRIDYCQEQRQRAVFVQRRLSERANQYRFRANRLSAQVEELKQLLDARSGKRKMLEAELLATGSELEILELTAQEHKTRYEQLRGEYQKYQEAQKARRYWKNDGSWLQVSKPPRHLVCIHVDAKDLDACQTSLFNLHNVQIPLAQKRKSGATRQLHWYRMKELQLIALKREQNKLEEQYGLREKLHTYLRTMLETIDKAVRILRHVRRLKASSITVTKLAHDIELVPMSGGLEISTTETQALTKETEITWSDKKRRAVIQYVARHIGPDWPTLFYSLPFSPPRGRLELEAMATRLMRSSPRGDHTVLAHNALNQWCQMNLTADPQMLCQTLMRIHRVQLAKWVCRKCKMQFSEAISKKTVEWICSGGRKTVVTPPHLSPISSSELHPSSSSPSALTLAINRLIAKSTGQDHMRDLSTDEGTTNTKTLPNYFKWYGLPVAMKTVREPKPIVNGSTSKNEREVPNNCDVTVSSLL